MTHEGGLTTEDVFPGIGRVARVNGMTDLEVLGAVARRLREAHLISLVGNVNPLQDVERCVI